MQLIIISLLFLSIFLYFWTKRRMRRRLNNIAKKAIEKQNQEYWDKDAPDRTLSAEEEEILRRIMNRSMENRRRFLNEKNQKANDN